jgi:hypothetical protein
VGNSDAGQIDEIDAFGGLGVKRHADRVDPQREFPDLRFQPGWAGNWLINDEGGSIPDFVAQTLPGAASPSSLQFSATLPVDGAISFERTIVDFFIPGANSPNPAQPHNLRFFIDNVPVGSWSGAAQTEGVAFQVPAGTHTFRWTFTPVTTPANPPTIPVPVPPDSVDRAFIDNIAFGPSFSGLSRGPQNLQDGFYANTFFATTSDGALYGISGEGIPQTIFDSDQDGVLEQRLETSLNGLTGLAFSPLDFNLWHTTFRRQNDLGLASTRRRTTRTTDVTGQRSLYFGLDQWQNIPDRAGSTYEILPDARH